MIEVIEIIEVIKVIERVGFCLIYLPIDASLSTFLNKGNNPDCYHHSVAEELSPNSLSVLLP